MANVRPKADAVIVGLGWCGSLIAEELTRAGLNVVAIERGPWWETATDFPPSVDTDELRWDTRRGMLLPPAIETTTFRNNRSQTALPTRDWNMNELGYNVGGLGHSLGRHGLALPALRLRALQLHDEALRQAAVDRRPDRPGLGRQL